MPDPVVTQPVVTTAAPAAPWYTGNAAVTPEILGHFQNRGVADKDAASVAIHFATAHREAERLIGAPADQMIRLPKPDDEAGWKQVWQRLGAPADKAGYDFSTVKTGDGKALEGPLADTLRDTAAAANLPKEAAARMATAVVKHIEGQQAAEATERAAKLVEAKAALAKSWGLNFEANKFIASQAAAAFKVDPQAVAAMEQVLGYDKVMSFFHSVGVKIGEDRFIANPGAGGRGVMTSEQATAKIAELRSDRLWSDRYLAGGVAENRELQGLILVAQGVAA